MVHAPVTVDAIGTASKLDAVSDEIDEVNILKGRKDNYNSESKFDEGKDKAGFRQYEAACDRVKNFYAVSNDPKAFVDSRNNMPSRL